MSLSLFLETRPKTSLALLACSSKHALPRPGPSPVARPVRFALPRNCG